MHQTPVIPTIPWIPTTPPGGIVGGIDQQQLYEESAVGPFGYTGSKKFAQTFQPSITARLSSIIVAMNRAGTPTDSLVLTIYSDGVTAPGTLLGTSDNSVLGSTIALNGNSKHHFTFATDRPSLTKDTTYWIVFSRSGSASDVNYYNVCGQAAQAEDEETDAYTRGTSYFQDGSNVWVSADTPEETWVDAYFVEYVL